MGAIAGRIIKSFFVHIPILLVALLLIYLVAQGQESLSASVRERFQGRSAQALLTVLGDARGQLMRWCFVSFTISWLASSLFLVSAERAAPANAVEARSRLGLWAAMLLVTILALFANGWISLLRPIVSGALASSTFMVAALIGGIATLLAYYLATSLVVRQVMRPSVPFSTAFPTFWS